MKNPKIKLENFPNLGKQNTIAAKHDVSKEWTDSNTDRNKGSDQGLF